MDVSNALSWADTALTVGRMALFIGCPTAGVTMLVGSFAIKAAAKIAFRAAAKKAILTSLSAGAAATLAASLMSSVGGGGGSGVLPYAAGIPAEALARTESVIELKVELSGSTTMEIDGEEIDKDDLLPRLLAQKKLGKLRSVKLLDKLGGRHGEWNLHVHQVANAIGLPVNSTEDKNE